MVKSGDKYVLKTDTGTYQIDDQDKAKQFEGKQVKVSGNLDKATSTLHVTDIQAAMQRQLFVSGRVRADNADPFHFVPTRSRRAEAKLPCDIRHIGICHAEI